MTGIAIGALINANTANAPGDGDSTYSDSSLSSSIVGAGVGGAIVAASGLVCGVSPEVSGIGGTLFGKGGIFNKGQNFRLGVGPNGGRKVFRASGDLVKKIRKNGHIDIRDLGPK